MMRLNLVLVAAVLFSALYLVRIQYESRRLYTELEKATNQAQKIEQEQERLQVDKRAHATPLRIENLAQTRLQMRTATPRITHYLQYVDPLSAAAVSPASAARGRP